MSVRSILLIVLFMSSVALMIFFFCLLFNQLLREGHFKIFSFVTLPVSPCSFISCCLMYLEAVLQEA